MNEFKRILVTGATGFIGSSLVKRLVLQGFKVGVVVRSDSDMRRLEHVKDKLLIFRAPLESSTEINEAVAEFFPDVIYHLATYYAISHTAFDISLMVQANVLGLMNLLDAAQKNDVKVFVNTSSCAIYESSNRLLREDSPIKPGNLYALTKVQGEQACDYYSQSTKLKVVTLRLFPPYGPDDNPRKVIPFLINAFKKGESPQMTSGIQEWDYIYVDDVIDAYMAILFQFSTLKDTHEIFNIGSGQAFSIRSIAETIKQEIGTKIEPQWDSIPHRSNEVWFLSADISKAKNILKWFPKTSLLKGLKETIHWCQNN